MSWPIRLLPEARVEFDEAIDWYERQRTGLSTAFLTRIREILDNISAEPERHPMVYRDVRKIVVPKFPFLILYRRNLDEDLVISVFHT